MDGDSRTRMALARVGFKVWSLNGQDWRWPSARNTAGGTLLDAHNPHVAALGRKLEERWETARLRW